MKHFFLLLLAALALISCSDDSDPVSPGTSQQDKYFSPKKITVYKLNQAPAVYNFTHDSTGLVLSEVWDNTDRFLYTYNSHGKPLTKTHDLVQAGSWQNSDSTLFTYDSQNNLLLELVRSQNENISKIEYTYNNQNLKISEINWGSSMGQLTPNYRYLYNYINNQMLSSTLETNGTSGWQYTSRSTYFYNTSGRLDSLLVEDHELDSWQKSMLMINSYNSAGKPTTQIIQSWNGSIWYNLYRGTITYDANQYITAMFVDDYDSSTGTWIPSLKQETQYNSEKLQNKVEWFAYVNNSWQPDNNDLSFSDDHYSFNNYGYKMEVEYAGFSNSSSSYGKPGQTDAPINEMFERLVKEKMAKAKH